MLILTNLIYILLITLCSTTIENPLPNILQYLLTNLIQHGVTLEFPNSQSHWLHLCDFYPVYVSSKCLHRRMYYHTGYTGYLLTNLSQHRGKTGVAWLTESEAVDQFNLSHPPPFQLLFLPISDFVNIVKSSDRSSLLLCSNQFFLIVYIGINFTADFTLFDQHVQNIVDNIWLFLKQKCTKRNQFYCEKCYGIFYPSPL